MGRYTYMRLSLTPQIHDYIFFEVFLMATFVALIVDLLSTGLPCVRSAFRQGSSCRQDANDIVA